MSTFSNTFSAVILVAILSAPGPVFADDRPGLSISIPNSRTLATQRKVEKLFGAGDYKRAFFIYHNELAPLGDKYAQYMIGYMHVAGLGVEEDYAEASAWYQLAAERGTREFVVARDRLTRDMSNEQIRKSDILYSELRLEFSDLAVLMTSIKHDYGQLKKKTGTRVNGDTSLLTVISPRSGGTRSGADYYGSIREQLETRLIQMKIAGDFEDFETDPDNINIHELEHLIEERLRYGE